MSSIANFVFVLLVQIQTIYHLKLRESLLTRKFEIDSMLEIAKDPSKYASYINKVEF